MEHLEAHVIWGDGLGDTERLCMICFSNTCVKPSYKDNYKILINNEAKKWDEENTVI